MGPRAGEWLRGSHQAGPLLCGLGLACASSTIRAEGAGWFLKEENVPAQRNNAHFGEKAAIWIGLTHQPLLPSL